MKILIHQNSKTPIKVLSADTEALKLDSKTCTEALWELAEKFPDEVIGWCEADLEQEIAWKNWKNIFHRELMMTSYAVKTTFLPESIGFIDQLPFVNVDREVKFATWQMSADIGGITGKTLLRFKKHFGDLEDFEVLINAIAKLGQQNGLFCYSEPHLVKPIENGDTASSNSVETNNFKTPVSTAKLFNFVAAHYKRARLLLLFWCFFYYKKSFPIFALLQALFQKSYFRKEVNLDGLEKNLADFESKTMTIDVIIPTLGRRDYLLQVLEDLKNQTHIPEKVIVVEQNSEIGAISELPELQSKTWPFKIVHHFTHKTGACNARNIALQEVDADWVFFADDDIRFSAKLLEHGLKEIKKYSIDCLNLNCKQEGEKTVFQKVKQWGSFGSGTSIVNANYCRDITFSRAFEYGFGEDKDYGMQLRLAGCDIIYHPDLEILHLKAPRGGFRQTTLPPWEKDRPKPSPTLMLYAKKYYSREQFLGFKIELFLRFYPKQPIKNPLKYVKTMQKRWKASEAWVEKLKTTVKNNQT